MSKSAIEWTDYSWNPVTGCTPVSEGCANCYAQHMAQRLKGRYGYPKDDPFRPGTVHEDRMEEPLRWKKPRRVFVCSMGDPFHDAVRTETIDRILEVILACPQHTFMLLTKRPQNIERKLYEITEANPIRELGDNDYIPNLWFGVSVENQAAANERIPELLKTPAAVRFVSCEPLLGPVDLERYLINCADCGNRGSSAYVGQEHDLCFHVCPKKGEGPRLDWVICGGETGPGARPMHPDWVRSLRDQCWEAEVPFFFKSWGNWRECQPPNEWINEDPKKYTLTKAHNSYFVRLNRRAAGRVLDGQTWSQWPEA